MKTTNIQRLPRYVTFACALLFLTVPTNCMLAALAISAPGTSGLTENSGSSNTYGWVFTVGASDLLVSGLGVWDDGQNGLVASHPIGIWSGNKELLATTIVPSGTLAPLVGEFRVQALPTALTLTRGASYTIGALYQGDESFNGSSASAPTVSPFITGLEPRFVFGQNLKHPTNGPQPGVGPTPYVGPTFEFVAVPVPESSSLDSSFNPVRGADALVRCLAIQPDQKILFGGDFRFYDFRSSKGLVRCNPDGSSDTTFQVGEGPTNATGHRIFCLSLQQDGKILAGGDFTSWSGQNRYSFCRLNGDGTLDRTFNTNAGFDATVYATAVQPDGKILVGGAFNIYDGNYVTRLTRLNSSGSLDTSFYAVVDPVVNTIVLQPDGKILLGGYIRSLNGQPVNYIARLNSDGSTDTSFVSAGAFHVTCIALQTDGKVLVSGDFTSWAGENRSGVVRLLANGNLDPQFNMGGPIAGPYYRPSIESIAIQNDGKIVIGGSFNVIAGQVKYYVARLNSDGSLDRDFTAYSGDALTCLGIQNDGQIVIGGSFTNVGSVFAGHVARLNSTALPARILSIRFSQPYSIRFGLTGPNGNYHLQSSRDLAEWFFAASVSTNVLPNYFDWQETNELRQFYRLKKVLAN